MDCFLCRKIIIFANARHHFSNDHDLFFENGDCNSNFVCINDDCVINFTTFKSFRRHFLNFHTNIQNDKSTNPDHGNLNGEIMEISNQENSLITSFEDDNSTNTLNLKSIVDTFISKIRQKMSITETDLSFLVSNFGETVENILNYFNISDPEVDLVKSMFSKSKTFKAQKTIQSQNIRTVDPEEGMLGYRTETRLKNGRNILMNIKETFQYLPITKTLANIILNKHYFHLINNEKISSDQCPKIIKSFTDTETFRNHPFLKKFPKSIRISLYYDCVEMANIGGSKTGFNNIALFYFTIQNLSYPVNTELQNIFILLACYARDLKKYGFRKILEPLVEELKHFRKRN